MSGLPVSGDIDAKKSRKTFPKLEINFFSILTCEFLLL